LTFKISIITINLNNAFGLKRTVQSVIAQKFKDFEFIIIDGGSNDGSTKIIEEYADKINHWVSESDNGIYHAMNKGIKLTQGEYLLFLNSGDELLDPESLSSINDSLKDTDIIYTNLVIKDSKSTYTREYPSTLSFNYFLTDSLPHPATFIKKSIFDKIGLYYEDLKICSDWGFFINAICKYNFTYKHLDTAISIFYFDGISSSPEQAQLIQLERRKILERDFPLYIGTIDEVKEARALKQHLKDSRLLKIARKFGFLRHILK